MEPGLESLNRDHVSFLGGCFPSFEVNKQRDILVSGSSIGKNTVHNLSSQAIGSCLAALNSSI